jgi:ADP-ribosylglycohydrolase
MVDHPDKYLGCLLGLAVGDALGVTVDSKSYQRICQDYGPAGLLGYDLVNGCANVSSYTQVAAYALNSLLVSIAKGRTNLEGYLHYLKQGLGEWAHAQHLPGAPRTRCCWIYHVPQMRQKRCMDPRTLDALTREVTGTMEAPSNGGTGPGTLTAAAMVGLYFSPERLQFQDLGVLAGQVVALTHGSPVAFLSGALLSYIIALCLHHPNAPLKMTFNKALDSIQEQYGHQYSQCFELVKTVRHAMTYAESRNVPAVEAMEQLQCLTAAQVVAGAVYACLTNSEDFDRAMITAVNHSGRSAAVGAVAGAILGARMCVDSLPRFYMECLEPAELLRELADDLFEGCPMEMGNKLFDLDWDHKYLHGGM